MNILIVEDDQLAADFIELLVRDHTQGNKVIGKVRSVKEAREAFQKSKPDLVFMDINLGDHTSFDIFKSIDPSDITVIFTSSYQEFALQAIKVDAVDYLLKPINIEEFIKAVGKVQKRLESNSKSAGEEDRLKQGENYKQKVVIYENDVVKPLNIDDIIKIRSDGSYSKIFMADERKYTSTKSIGMYEKLLSELKFIRIHDSCLVNSQYIQSYVPGTKAAVILSDGTSEPMSRTRKREFLNFYRELMRG